MRGEEEGRRKRGMRNGHKAAAAQKGRAGQDARRIRGGEDEERRGGEEERRGGEEGRRRGGHTNTQNHLTNVSGLLNLSFSKPSNHSELILRSLAAWAGALATRPSAQMNNMRRLSLQIAIHGEN